MIPIFIASLSQYAGKNVISLGLALRFRKDGYKTGYFKPIGLNAVAVGDIISDEDAAFFHCALQLEDPLDTLCPIVLTERMIENLFAGQFTGARQKIMEGYKTASAGKDILICMGIGFLPGGLFVGMSHYDFVRETKAKTILIDKATYTSPSVDGCLRAKEQLGDLLAGVVFNRLKPRRKEYVERTIAPYLESRGIPVLGIIAEDPVLGAVPVRAIVESLNAKVLCCEDKLDELVERLMIGAMNMDTAIRHFRRTPNKAVITGGDRPDIQLAALETSTKCIILTGNIQPSPIILGRAEEVGVPVILVNYDTLSAVEIIERFFGKTRFHQEKKLHRFVQMLDERFDFGELYRALGLSK